MNVKSCSLKAINTPESACIFRSDPQELNRANRNWDYSVPLPLPLRVLISRTAYFILGDGPFSFDPLMQCSRHVLVM